MSFPKTIDELKAHGYEEKNEAACRGCGALLTWWKAPHGVMIPMDRGTATAHFATCPDASRFRKKEKR